MPSIWFHPSRNFAHEMWYFSATPGSITHTPPLSYPYTVMACSYGMSEYESPALSTFV